MAHFAKLGINSKVIGVEVVADADCQNADNNEDETVGIQFLENIHGWPLWKQTSYNTLAGEHKLGGTPFRKNYAGVGYTYDPVRDAFYAPQPFESWTLNEDTCSWESPVAIPEDGNSYLWDEETKNWILEE